MNDMMTRVVKYVVVANWRVLINYLFRHIQNPTETLKFVVLRQNQIFAL